MSEINDSIFRQQIQDDIEIIQETVPWADHIEKDEYAFNYWVLSKIYNLDEEACINNITEYNDKGIDCFVHYEEDKELYIIQNKYYGEDTKLNSKEVSDFLTRPISYLEEGKYKKSPELQKIYNKVKENRDDYTVFLHFFVTDDKKTEGIEEIIKNHNRNNGNFAEMFYLSDIKDKYYGKSYDENVHLDFQLSLKVKSSALAIRPEEYNLKNMSKAFYVMAKVQEIYNLWLQANEKKYPLFEKNIREYLGGGSGINKDIINTLDSLTERHKFFYYNNGITIICSEARVPKGEQFNIISLTDPQIVNGCQTVSSIAEALKKSKDINDFEDVYVMAKILEVKKSKADETFHTNVVKYTNSQNSINEKAFGAKHQPFFTLQKEIEERGFLLCVKQSDKHKFKEKYNKSKPKGILLDLAKKSSSEFYKVDKKITDVQISLEHLIQIIGAFTKDAHFAYTKKNLLLKPNNKEYYQDFSLKINDFFTTKQMIKLIILYKRAEFDKRKGVDKRKDGDKRTPSPYYLLNFLSFYLNQRGIELKTFLEKIKMDQLNVIYNEFRNLSNDYHVKCGFDYNEMLKKPVNEEIMREVLNNHLDGLKKHNRKESENLEKIFSNLKTKEDPATNSSALI